MDFQHSTIIERPRRKAHCAWCNELMPSGVAHVYVAARFEGDFWTGRFHDECFSAFNRTCEGQFIPGQQTRGGDWNDSWNNDV